MAEQSLNLEDKLALCQYPEIEPEFNKALHEVATFIMRYVPDVLAILACGSILRGDGGPSSDLDMYVLRQIPQRQRLQKWFNGVPCEIFINPVHQVHKYFEHEKRDWRVVTAHMVATGFVILQLDESLDHLRSTAQEIIKTQPVATEMELTTARYMAACRFEDAIDIAETRPEASLMIMNMAVYAMLHYAFKKAGRYFPRDKDMLIALQALDTELAVLTAQYYASDAGFAARVAIARDIANRTIETYGFFAWESKLENV